MNDNRERTADRSMSRWLEAGPSQAPEGLLERAMARTATTRQRPSTLAVLLGAPGAGVAGRTPIASARLAALLAVLLMLLVVATALVAGGLVDRNLLALTPSGSPTLIAGPTVHPSQAPRPLPTLAATERPQFVNVYEDPDRQFAVDLDPNATTYNGAPHPAILESPELDAVTFNFGKCFDFLDVIACPQGVLVASAVDGDPIAVSYTPGETISGRTLDELLERWTRRFGRSSVATLDVAGVPGLLVRGTALPYPAPIAILTIHGDRSFVISGLAGSLHMAMEPTDMQRFAEAFHWLDRYPASSGEAVTCDDPPFRALVPRGFQAGLRVPFPLSSPRPSCSEYFLAGQSVDQLFPPTRATLIIGARAASDFDLALDGWLATKRFVRMVDRFLGDDRLVLLLPDGTTYDPMALLVHGDRLYTITSHDQEGAAAAERTLRTFLSGFTPLP